MKFLVFVNGFTLICKIMLNMLMDLEDVVAEERSPQLEVILLRFLADFEFF